MKFRLEPQFTSANIKQQTLDIITKTNKVILNELSLIGLEAVKYAREKIPYSDYHRDAKDVVSATKLAGASLDFEASGSFNDQTGNLRSSIGYIIMYDGEVIHQDFELSPVGTEKQDGLSAGKRYAVEAGADVNSGWALIIVAGMQYASWVEAMGYDVIYGATLYAREDLKEAIKRVENLKIF